MIKELLSEEVQAFIRDHENDDPATLMLQSAKFPHLPMREIVEQIQSRKKAKLKIPEWYRTNKVIYPPTISLEQCSSEQTALFKKGMVSGKKMVDLTGGMGIDTFYLRQSFDHVDYVERQEHLVEIAKHNFERLGSQHIDVHQLTAEAFIQSANPEYDLIFLDPARRDDQKQKVFRFADCEPNVTELLPALLKKSKQVLIKASPLLDIKQAIKELEGLTEVHVVAVKGEVKELLLLIDSNNVSNDPIVNCVDLRDEPSLHFSFSFSEEANSDPSDGSVQEYLFEPNASILKGGGFKSIAEKYGLIKLHPNTHLYTSKENRPDFPGRIFEVVDSIKLSKKAIKESLPEMKANITVRNYPLSVDQIRKKTGLKEGGDHFIFATRDTTGLQVLLCSKIN